MLLVFCVFDYLSACFLSVRQLVETDYSLCSLASKALHQPLTITRTLVKPTPDHVTVIDALTSDQ